MTIHACAVLVAVLSGCALIHPKAGDACQTDQAVCSSKSSALVCREGLYVAMGCGGQDGCVMASDRTVSCDQSQGAKAGEVCLKDYEGQIQCEQDGKPGFLMCKGGTWERGECSKTGAVCKRTAESVYCTEPQSGAEPAP